MLNASVVAAALRLEIETIVFIGVVVTIAILATSGRCSSRKCARCKEVNRKAAVYCAQCGTRLSGS